MVFKSSGIINVYRFYMNGTKSDFYPIGGNDTIPWFNGETVILRVEVNSTRQTFYLDNVKVLSLK